MLLAILSVTSLLWHAFHVGFIAPIQLALEWYESLLNFALGWMEPYVIEFVKWATKWLYPSWNIKLNPDWKNVFVMTLLYYSSMVRARMMMTGREKLGVPRVAKVYMGEFLVIRPLLFLTFLFALLSDFRFTPLFALSIFIGMAILHAVGGVRAVRRVREPSESRWSCFKREGGSVAFAMIGTLIGAIGFVAANAGLKLAGL